MRDIELKALIIAVAITMSITGLFMYIFSKQKEKPTTIDTDKTSYVTVVVALEDITAKTELTEKNIGEISVPADMVNGSSIKDKTQALGKVAKENIYKDEQLRVERVSDINDKSMFSNEVPKGYRAISIKIDALSSLGGSITKGDLVDIFVYLKPPFASKEQTSTPFQKIKVIDTNYDTKNPKEYVYVTLCMLPEEAEKLYFLDSIGDITLVLRNMLDDANVTFPVIDLNNIK